MTNWKNSLIGLDATIRDAVNTLNDGGFQIALVVDVEDNLAGTITDGDIRRALLNGQDMDAAAKDIMNSEPVTAALKTADQSLLETMNATLLRQIPLIDEDDQVAGLVHIRDLTRPIEIRENWVVLMAGGLGERLRPLTEETPKPLLNVGGKPLLQTILEKFIEQNFRQFYISVNYKADVIKAHFGNGEKWNVDIRYLEEDSRRGTAGALRLIPKRPNASLIVMNGDLITEINFQDLLDFHRQQKSKATMCVREYDFQVPFGVVGIEGNRIKSIDEKPIHRFFVNAGIYALDPSLIDTIPTEGTFDMTELFETVISTDKNTAVFPIHEYWLDIGRTDDLERANIDYKKAIIS
ncbi:MAG: CBS domain-containing protein [Rhodospirillales bacterium]|nr:CBS domain-containing protein [Rhodospirillales bacterium]MBT7771509.1 CBS domain-containing protein [Rhodospirillales bacterium]MBT8004408.1 CBS domain-containing protein [Rhodospirillales bacterium]